MEVHFPTLSTSVCLKLSIIKHQNGKEGRKEERRHRKSKKMDLFRLLLVTCKCVQFIIACHPCYAH